MCALDLGVLSTGVFSSSLSPRAAYVVSIQNALTQANEHGLFLFHAAPRLNSATATKSEQDRQPICLAMVNTLQCFGTNAAVLLNRLIRRVGVERRINSRRGERCAHLLLCDMASSSCLVVYAPPPRVTYEPFAACQCATYISRSWIPPTRKGLDTQKSARRCGTAVSLRYVQYKLRHHFKKPLYFEQPWDSFFFFGFSTAFI